MIATGRDMVEREKGRRDRSSPHKKRNRRTVIRPRVMEKWNMYWKQFGGTYVR